MKERLFLDTNIIIDYLADRQPFSDDACRIFLESESSDVELCISALSLTTIYYVLRKKYEHRQLLNLLDKLCSLVTILPTDKYIIKYAMHSGFSDFEDAVQYYTALSGNSTKIITRNVKDYVQSEIEVLTPIQYLNEKAVE